MRKAFGVMIMDNTMREILYYGITLENYDVLDFTDDFLAGVRANYFNSGLEAQINRSVQVVGMSEYSFMYEMKKGAQLSWKVNRDGALFQSAEPVSPDSYRVNTFNPNGRLVKSHYFDYEHMWIKSEFYSGGHYPDVVLIPETFEDQRVILKLQYNPDSTIRSYLYPKTEPPENGDYSALAFTDSGFLYYNSIPNKKLISKTLIRDDSVTNLAGFNFDPVDFDMRRNLNTSFDITECEYLTEDNGNPIHTDTNEPFVALSDDYDPDDSEECKIFEKEERKPELEINSNGSSYSYYGEIDGENRRHGRGRTVSESGITAYEGEYREDKRDGFGAFYYKNGELNYVGNWSENLRQGFGVSFSSADKTARIGNWNKNRLDGVGAQFDKNGGFVFLGSYVNGKKQGRGITIDSDGSFVVSEYKDDEVVSSFKIDDLLNNLK